MNLLVPWVVGERRGGREVGFSAVKKRGKRGWLLVEIEEKEKITLRFN